jgi:hypothetical protein
MPKSYVQLIEKPTIISAAGNKPKSIEEFIGRANSGTGQVSVARMRSPAGWQEPGQTPEFDEYTVVLAGTLRVETSDQVFQVGAGPQCDGGPACRRRRGRDRRRPHLRRDRPAMVDPAPRIHLSAAQVQDRHQRLAP